MRERSLVLASFCLTVPAPAPSHAFLHTHIHTSTHTHTHIRLQRPPRSPLCILHARPEQQLPTRRRARPGQLSLSWTAASSRLQHPSTSPPTHPASASTPPTPAQAPSHPSLSCSCMAGSPRSAPPPLARLLSLPREPAPRPTVCFAVAISGCQSFQEKPARACFRLSRQACTCREGSGAGSRARGKACCRRLNLLCQPHSCPLC